MTFDSVFNLQKEMGINKTKRQTRNVSRVAATLLSYTVSRIWNLLLEGNIFFFPLLLHSQIYMENSNITKVNPALKISVMTFWCHILKLNLLILLVFMFHCRLKGPPLEFLFWTKSIRPRYSPFNCQPSPKMDLISFIVKLRKKIQLQCDSLFMWDPETKNG